MTHTDLINKLLPRIQNPRNSKEFFGIVFDEVKARSNYSDRELKGWLRSILPKFGTPGWDWTRDGAKDCARCFLSEASTW